MIVKINILVKRYKEVLAVDHLSLEINEGEVLSLLGPSGELTNADIQLLRYMVNQTYLNIRSLDITDISPLAGLLTVLSLDSYPIEDWSPIENRSKWVPGLPGRLR